MEKQQITETLAVNKEEKRRERVTTQNEDERERAGRPPFFFSYRPFYPHSKDDSDHFL